MSETPRDRRTDVARDGGPYRYRPDVLATVWRHGIMPTERTPPELARGYVRELYKYEIRRLRERYLSQEFSKREYAGRVEALRQRYGVLALVPAQWLIDSRAAFVSPALRPT